MFNYPIHDELDHLNNGPVNEYSEQTISIFRVNIRRVKPLRTTLFLIASAFRNPLLNDILEDAPLSVTGRESDVQFFNLMALIKTLSLNLFHQH